MPDIYAGEQLQLVGRYTTPGDITVTVTGTDTEGPVEHTFAGTLTDDPTINTFVPKIWARWRIEFLLSLMDAESSGSALWKEWRDEIIRLGLQYGIVTPFTSFTDQGTPDEDEEENEGPVSVDDLEIAMAVQIVSISPNPVSTRTTISIDLTAWTAEDVTVEIIDVNGNVIAELYRGAPYQDVLKLEWLADNAAGTPVANGTYFVAVTIDGVRTLKQIVVIR